MEITLTVNGEPITADVEPRTLLVHFLRDDLRLTGTHVGCETSYCGACTIHVDGRPVPELGEHTAIVKGDRKCQSIACASILAKVVRDRLMRRLHPRYPDYGWESNMGYATGEHLAAIRRVGPSPHHRATWKPIAQRELELAGTGGSQSGRDA